MAALEEKFRISYLNAAGDSIPITKLENSLLSIHDALRAGSWDIDRYLQGDKRRLFSQTAISKLHKAISTLDKAADMISSLIPDSELTFQELTDDSELYQPSAAGKRLPNVAGLGVRLSDIRGWLIEGLGGLEDIAPGPRMAIQLEPAANVKFYEALGLLTAAEKRIKSIVAGLEGDFEVTEEENLAGPTGGPGEALKRLN